MSYYPYGCYPPQYSQCPPSYPPCPYPPYPLCGPTGPSGAQGFSGAQGPSGAQGLQGVPGTDSDTGATGAQGYTGATGAQGFTGATGAQGFTGATGAQGAQGTAGSASQTGATGAQGFTGATGAQGAQGTAGSASQTGATGAQGFTGATGAQGAQGTAGSASQTGATGAQGERGFIGDTGAQGAQGETGSSNSNADAIFITDETTGTTTTYIPYVKATGATQPMYVDTTGLTYNNTTNTLTTTTFAGTATNSNAVDVSTWSIDGTLYPTLALTNGSAKIIYKANSLSYINDTATLVCPNFSGALSGNASSASQVEVASSSTNANYYLLFVLNVSGNQSPLTGFNLYYNPLTNTLTSPIFSGSLSGNATSATSATNVTITSDNTAGTYYIPFSKTSGTGNKPLYQDDTSIPLTYNPSTNTITASNFSGNATTATTATNISGGSAGAIPNQSASSSTQFLNAGPANSYLVSNGSAPVYRSVFDNSPKNILSITDASYTTTTVAFTAGSGADTTTYGNYIQAMLNKVTYNHEEGLICGSTLDTSNYRFNILVSGVYLLTLSTSINSLTANGNLINHVFINGTQYSNSPTNTVFWGSFGVFMNTIIPETFSMTYLTLRLNPGDFIDIRGRQSVSSSSTGYTLGNGTTICLERVR